jgi:glycine cleavage system H protein
MMSIPDNIVYSRDHEWVRQEGDILVVGITHHAQDQLGDVVFVELSEVGEVLEAGASFGTVESVKAVSDLLSPLSGVVAEVNSALEDAAELVNSDPYGKGWLIKIQSDDADLSALLSAADYSNLLQGS